MTHNPVAPQVVLTPEWKEGMNDARYGLERKEDRTESADYHDGYNTGQAANRMVGGNYAPTKEVKL